MNTTDLIESIRKMTDVSKMLESRNDIENTLDQERIGYTLEEYVKNVLPEKNYNDIKSTVEYVEFSAKIKNIDLSDKNPLLQEMYSIISSYWDKSYKNITPTEDEVNLVKKLMRYDRSYKVHWGKYSGSSIEDILINDPQYILWCMINLSHFAMGGAIFRIKELRNSDHFLSALEVNVMKMHIILEREEEIRTQSEGVDASELWEILMLLKVISLHGLTTISEYYCHDVFLPCSIHRFIQERVSF